MMPVLNVGLIVLAAVVGLVAAATGYFVGHATGGLIEYRFAGFHFLAGLALLALVFARMFIDSRPMLIAMVLLTCLLPITFLAWQKAELIFGSELYAKKRS